MKSIRSVVHFGIACLLLFFSASAFGQSSDTWEKGQLFVKVKAGTPLNLSFEFGKTEVQTHWQAQQIEKYGLQRVQLPFHLDNDILRHTYLVEFDRDEMTAAMMTELRAHPAVEYVERVPAYELFYTPNDPQLANQWNLATVQAQNAWDISQGNTNVVVAIVDDAVLLNHQDLNGNLWVNTGEIAGNNIDDDGNGYTDDINGYDVADGDPDPNPPAGTVSNSNFTHGTHVAGITGATTDDMTGIASIGFNVQLMAVKCKASSTSGGSLQAPYAGVQYAIANDVDIINMSWGGSGFSVTYQALFDQAYLQGIVNIAAAGNSNTSAPMYPASYNHVISVGATSPNDAKASFSNYGATIDVMAPGDGILSTLAGSNTSYGPLSGTSMAAPLVSGIASLMLAYDPFLSPDDLEDCLENTCDNINAVNPGYVGQIGAGRVNAFEALRCLKPITAAFTSDFTTVCPGGQVQYTDLSNNMPNAWQWSFPGGAPATSNLQNPTVTYPAAGQYDVTLIVFNANGSDTLTVTNYITVATPTAVLSGGATILAGFSATLRVDFTGNPPYDFAYSDGSTTTNVNNVTANPYFFQVSPPVTTTYNLVSMSDSLCGGTVSGAPTITVNQNSGCNAASSWNRTYGGTNVDKAFGVTYTNDGGVIACGSTQSFGLADEEVYLIKLDACGYVEWSRTYGVTGDDWGADVEQTMDGGYAVTVYTELGAGVWDILLIKTDALGNHMWTRQYPGGSFDYPRDVVEAPDSGFVICGVSGT
ncbi:MAG: S8 family serine peptidase, partial [Bacteroidota bacterium]